MVKETKSELITVREAVRLLRMSPSRVYEHIKNGLLKSVKLDVIMLYREDVERFKNK